MSLKRIKMFRTRKFKITNEMDHVKLKKWLSAMLPKKHRNNFEYNIKVSTLSKPRARIKCHVRDTDEYDQNISCIVKNGMVYVHRRTPRIIAL